MHANEEGLPPIKYNEEQCARVNLEWRLPPLVRALRNTLFNMVNLPALVVDIPSKLVYALAVCAGLVTGFKVLRKCCGGVAAKKRKADRSFYVENAGRHLVAESTGTQQGAVVLHRAAPVPVPSDSH